MEYYFVCFTLGAIIPIYLKALIEGVGNLYQCGGYIKNYLLYKKVKLDFEFDTENNLLSIATPENLPDNMSIKYEIQGITFKEIMRFAGDDKCIYRLRTYRTTTDDNINNWTHYMNNGSFYKFKSFSYVFV